VFGKYLRNELTSQTNISMLPIVDREVAEIDWVTAKPHQLKTLIEKQIPMAA
jgi:hypothetical protein